MGWNLLKPILYQEAVSKKNHLSPPQSIKKKLSGSINCMLYLTPCFRSSRSIQLRLKNTTTPPNQPTDSHCFQEKIPTSAVKEFQQFATWRGGANIQIFSLFFVKSVWPKTNITEPIFDETAWVHKSSRQQFETRKHMKTSRFFADGGEDLLQFHCLIKLWSACLLHSYQSKKPDAEHQQLCH